MTGQERSGRQWAGGRTKQLAAGYQSVVRELMTSLRCDNGREHCKAGISHHSHRHSTNANMHSVTNNILNWVSVVRQSCLHE